MIYSKTQKILVWILAFAILLVGGFYLFKKYIGTVNIPSTVNLPATESTKGEQVSYLKAPSGISVTLYAKGIPGARVIAFDRVGRMLVSQTSQGKIAIIEDSTPRTLVSGLKNPHGLAFNCDPAIKDKCDLYVAESNALSRYQYDETTGALSGKTKLLDIAYSATDRHSTRTLLFLPQPNQDTLLISVGSSCDVCHEKSPDYASIISYNVKTGQKQTYATGLRNSVFMALNPKDGKVYATEMGHDNLGDNIPPDEINMIENKNNQPQNYGWPNCYGKNIHDTVFDKNTYIRNPCMEPFEIPSFMDLQAHSAPLGLAFIPDSANWGDYKNNLIIAYHGSWNRTVATGYKVVRTAIDGEGNPGAVEDFITGWLTPDGKKLGRPVDVKISPTGIMYISDDLAGVIYQVTKQ